MKPWDIATSVHTEDYIIRKWAKLVAAEFCFAAVLSKYTETILCIVPVAYFDEYHHAYNHSMPISHLLPEGLLECLPSVFHSKEQLLKVYKKMFDKGFAHNKEFQSFIDGSKLKKALDC